MIGSVKDVESIDLLSDIEFHATLLRTAWDYDRDQYKVKRIILGSVPEGEDLVHVLARVRVTHLERYQLEQLEIISCIKAIDGSWLVAPTQRCEKIARNVSLQRQILEQRRSMATP